jgi:glucose-1-phosphate cytidylyltransferase
MTGCRIKRIEPYIRGDNFLVTYGDGVSDIDLTQLVRFHREHGRIATLTSVRPPGRFGEIELEGDSVVEFSEKPLGAPGWINGGFFVFNRAIFDRLDDEPGLVLERRPLTALARDGELMAYRHSAFWHPMDTSRDFKLLNDLHDSGAAPWMTWKQRAACVRSRKSHESAGRKGSMLVEGQ